MRIKFDKIDEFICGGEFRYLILFEYGLFDKIYDKIKYLKVKTVVLETVLLIILENSELIHIILYLVN